jgi:pseudouridine-5'-phosphate glycosidase
MTPVSPLELHADVQAALRDRRPVVLLSTTPFAHSLPAPVNTETAREVDAVIRREGALPAFAFVHRGRPTVSTDLAALDEVLRDPLTFRASRRDLAGCVVKGLNAAVTVAAGMALAHLAGIRVLATGAIGGAQGAPSNAWDVSADLVELSRTPVAVVCSGARSLLDLSCTLEILESYRVPVIGYQSGTFPAFYVRSSSLPLSFRTDTPDEAATLARTHWDLGGAGLVLAQPVSADAALDPDDFRQGMLELERQASARDVRGKSSPRQAAERLARLTKGKTVRAYRAILVANARVGAQVAGRLAAESAITARAETQA